VLSSRLCEALSSNPDATKKKGGGGGKERQRQREKNAAGKMMLTDFFKQGCHKPSVNKKTQYLKSAIKLNTIKQAMLLFTPSAAPS
jgi:hypothetical protein